MMTNHTWLNPISSKNGFFMSHENRLRDRNSLNLIKFKFFSPIDEGQINAPNAHVLNRLKHQLIMKFDDQQAIIFEKNGIIYFCISADELFRNERPLLSDNGANLIEALSKILCHYSNFQFEIREEFDSQLNVFKTFSRAKSLELTLRQIILSIKNRLTIAPFLHRI